MSNTSATGGFLQPSATPKPLEDEALDDFLQPIIAGVTGLPVKMVRPRWQESPPPMPAFGVNWVGFGITDRDADAFAVEQHLDDGDGAQKVTRHEQLTLLASFYGKNCQGFGAKLRDGISLAQNREALAPGGLVLVSVGTLTRAPELIKNKWWPRADLSIVLRRQVDRIYPVLNILSAAGSVTSAVISTSFDTEP